MVTITEELIEAIEASNSIAQSSFMKDTAPPCILTFGEKLTKAPHG